ncbi:MAG: hypothetical protein QM753_14875 [Thermomicrobiales bacterium]
MGRRLVQGVLLVAIFLMLPVSVVGIWVRQEVVDTDAWVASVRDLPANPDVQDALVALVGDAVSSRVTTDWETFVTDTVSSRTIQVQLLGLDVDIRGFVEDRTRTLIQSPAFTPIWVSINEAAHPLVRDVVLGNDSPAVERANGDIVLNISPVYNALVQQLATEGIDLTRVIPAEVDDLTMTIYDSPSLQQTQRVMRLIDRWAIPLAVISVVLAAVVLLVSQRKAFAGAMIGLTVLLSMAFTQVALTLTVRFVLDRNLEPVQRDAAAAVIRAVTESLRTWALGIGIAGAVVMVICLVLQSVGRHQTRAVYRR